MKWDLFEKDKTTNGADCEKIITTFFSCFIIQIFRRKMHESINPWTNSTALDECGKYIYNASFLIKRLRQFNVNVGNATVHIANRKNIKCVYVEGK